MEPLVRVTGGLVRGSVTDGVAAYLGIPYAAPAVGPARYLPPQPVRPWAGERDATRHGPTSDQLPYPPPLDAILASSVDPGDDYLNVAVWAPADGGGGLPVMVWVPGGAFVRGANSIPTYDGSAFARDGIILVGVNYRLGVPGFGVLDGGTTNLGLRDQIAALEWVRDNIAAFGGDPDRVTIFGESAGGMSVATLLASPAARGLFHRAIVQSGGATSVATVDDARRVTAEIATALGVPPTAEAFAAADPGAVLAAWATVALALQQNPDPARWGASVLRGGLGIMSVFPVVDGDLVPDIPLHRIAQGCAADIPLLVGYTSEEFRLFAVPVGLAASITAATLPLFGARLGWPAGAIATYAANRPSASPGDLACAILTDSAFRVPAGDLAASQSEAGGTVFQYEFAWRTPVAGLGAAHAVELAFVFDTLAQAGPMVGTAPPQPLADEVHAAWVAFGASGDPGWARWSPHTPSVRVFDVAGPAVVVGPRSDELALWR